MGWLSSFFSSTPQASQYSRKGQALSSTHEAFSLPTSSPTFAAHPDAFNPESLQTPDLEATMSPTYTYPPQGPGAYGYVPTSAGPNSRPTSLLPTHHDSNHSPLSPKFSYPPLATTWNRLRTWLDREYPELGDTLNYGILPQDLAEIEMQFGFALPPAVRESYLCVDGQEAESAAGCSEGLFFGLKLLPLEDVLQEWRFWREVDDDPTTGANSQLREVMQSIPPGWVRKEYSQRGWIPLIADKVGNYVGVDLNPDEAGSVGQVIVFGRDFDSKVVLWRGDGPAGWAKWLASFVEELESGEGFELGSGNEASDDSEDDLGYESYFYDGTGRGQGDGGGDAGSGGGLRLAGEYRGWNVFEAWADRSLRRWHEAGVITDTSLSPAPEEPKAPGPAVMDVTHESSAEVGIPVLADVDDPIPAPTVAPGHKHTTSNNAPGPLPTISVTRAPAPLPVALPQPQDILSTPVSSQSSFDEDLESGRSVGMREVSNLVPSPKLSKPQSPAVQENAGASSLVTSSSSRSRPTSPSDTTRSTSQRADIPDLLADFAPAMDTKPIAPSSPASVQAETMATPALEPIPAELPDSAETPDDASSKPVDEEEVDPNTTIRLVGGGGIVGTVQPEEEEESQLEEAETDADAVSVTEEASEAMSASAKTHKKTKSGLAGLKKLGNLGKKRDSNSSVKGTAGSPAAT
ncbi:putative SMI1 / KNR4 family protein [Lyophyllum shimeji]|uniref:SMI1 / KNR4 family protein n=1 Tax=Lyophyllum shimeji TaxID=47721 RepID=A0A9P3PGK4_LYOSH|nr:putative SMI1 / KNR4 family protein [Lyophyllum shimeji]